MTDVFCLVVKSSELFFGGEWGYTEREKVIALAMGMSKKRPERALRDL